MKPFARPEIKLAHFKQNERERSIDLTIVNEGQYAQNLTYKSQGNVQFASHTPTTITLSMGAVYSKMRNPRVLHTQAGVLA
jgi:hypothetical protein